MPIIVPVLPSTVARVDFEIYNNATWQDAMQFGTPGDTTWSLTGQSFRCDIKADKLGSALLSLTSGAGQIVVDDVVQRVINFNVPEITLGVIIPGEYYYDFVMQDTSSPPIRVILMNGHLKVLLGISGG